jgi:AdoMet-dependent rRNA methyltransferase SPB1
VCQGFLAPKHIDPKFLEAKHVFKDVSALPASITLNPSDPSSSTSAAASLAPNTHATANVFHPEKKRRAREGYADGDYTLFHKATATDFVKNADPVVLLGSMNKIEFVTDEEKQ